MTQVQIDALEAAARETIHEAVVALEAAVLADDGKARHRAETALHEGKLQLWIWRRACERAKQAK